MSAPTTPEVGGTTDRAGTTSLHAPDVWLPGQLLLVERAGYYITGIRWMPQPQERYVKMVPLRKQPPARAEPKDAPMVIEAAIWSSGEPIVAARVFLLLAGGAEVDLGKTDASGRLAAPVPLGEGASYLLVEHAACYLSGVRFDPRARFVRIGLNHLALL